MAIFGNCCGDVKRSKNAFGTGVMPLDMTKSVLVSFEAKCNRASRYVTSATLFCGTPFRLAC